MRGSTKQVLQVFHYFFFDILRVVDPRSVLTTNRYYLAPVIVILQSFEEKLGILVAKVQPLNTGFLPKEAFLCSGGIKEVASKGWLLSLLLNWSKHFTTFRGGIWRFILNDIGRGPLLSI